MFTGLALRQFRCLVRIVEGRGDEQAGPGGGEACRLTDRVLLFGVLKSAAHRVVDYPGPLRARRRSPVGTALAPADRGRHARPSS